MGVSMRDKRNESVVTFLRSRRSVVAANLIEPGPTNDDLQIILEIGLRVPDHSRCGPWRVQIIRKKAQAKLGDLYANIFSAKNTNATENQIEYWRNRPQSAPILLAVSFYPNKEKLEKIPIWEQMLSGGALCQNILNASHALGYAAQWLTEWPAYEDKVKVMLGHDRKINIFGFIFIGSPSDTPKERKRIGSDEVVSEWSFGE